MARHRTSLIRRQPSAPKLARRNAAPKKVVRRARAAVHTTVEAAENALEKAGKLMTPAAGASVAAGAALGSAIGARIVANESLTPNQTAAAMVATGGAASYIGYRTDTPILFGGGIGIGIAGVSLVATHHTVESVLAEEAAKETAREAAKRPRNAGPIRLSDPDPYNDDSDGELDEYDDHAAIDEIEPLLER